ncbi:hypothetical protein FGO68_gene8190 [Halteria grandinella]|uniref:Uncharacterized protein n=1 Tax=Halteria grandinella TaxID=5974 RepID=A0A8J8SZJ2_HALGN|nr:hypothetical protein FGO68_gene8190 [Halteria grandinella]
MRSEVEGQSWRESNLSLFSSAFQSFRANCSEVRASRLLFSRRCLIDGGGEYFLEDHWVRLGDDGYQFVYNIYWAGFILHYPYNY